MGANLKEVRDRIASVKSTQQITKAMKMVSAAKLRRAQEAISRLKPYSNKLGQMLSSILTNLEGDVSSSYGDVREINSALVVVVTSNRGLCGAFNANIIKEAEAVIKEKYAGVSNLKIMCIGKRGNDYFMKRYPADMVISDHVMMFDDLSFDSVAKVSQSLLDAFDAKEYDAVDVAYGSFKNAATQYPIIEAFLPVPKVEIEEEKNKKHFKADYIFLPNKKELLDSLIPNILKTQFQKYLLDTHASEHGARMTAMDKATENANELMKELKISYNKARQEAITNEISEIVGGAAALEGA
ncbi:MAG TPA: ATP synthase F1 subunit gamma [Saprospiraceae bacterium]|nr:ATP synthase F1 subunit gamma [Saprospiraceae bacterium]